MTYVNDKDVLNIINTLRRYDGKGVYISTSSNLPLAIELKDGKLIPMYNYTLDVVHREIESKNVSYFNTDDFFYYYTVDRKKSWK